MAVGPADRHPGPSSQCQPADRRVRTSGWKLVRVSFSAKALANGRKSGEECGGQWRVRPCSIRQNSTWQALSTLPQSRPSQAQLPFLSSVPQWLFLASSLTLGTLNNRMAISIPQQGPAARHWCDLSLWPNPSWASAWPLGSFVGQDCLFSFRSLGQPLKPQTSVSSSMKWVSSSANFRTPETKSWEFSRGRQSVGSHVSKQGDNTCELLSAFPAPSSLSLCSLQHQPLH